ncbi:MAG: hypothetical protein JSR93_03585, partial [Verrucomicrobia bacterium]|nr:hypothetical protein [Verrucomicrobiota bacterium]
AQALFNATEQLWISMELLKKMIISDPKGTNLEIAYTFFADAVCNWESAYQSFTNSGGQPDPVSEQINQALNATLPDGQTIYQLSQTVSKNPADWQQLQSGISNNTLFSLFEDVNNWINVDGPAGSEGFKPVFSSSNEALYEQITVVLSYLNYCNENEGSSSESYYMGLLFVSVYKLNSMLSNDDGPICNLLSEMFNTPFFTYDGKNYSLEEMANYYVNSPNQTTSTQIQEAEDALNSCLPILNDVVNMAFKFMTL